MPKYPEAAERWASEQKAVCACGCGRPLRVTGHHYYAGLPRYLRGHNRPATPGQDWIRANQGKHFCQCGCGEAITLKIHHHSVGIPKFINRHSPRVHNPMVGKTGKDNPHYKGGRRKDSRGYVLVLVGSEEGRPVYALEHRLVMERLLGRALADGETVHHKNGIRHDNRPENLELWLSAQPAGQRVEDLIAFAAGLIGRYSSDPLVWPKEALALRKALLAGQQQGAAHGSQEQGQGQE